MYMQILLYSKIAGWIALYDIHMKNLNYSEICSQIILFGLKLPGVFSVYTTVPYLKNAFTAWSGQAFL